VNEEHGRGKMCNNGDMKRRKAAGQVARPELVCIVFVTPVAVLNMWFFAFMTGLYFTFG